MMENTKEKIPQTQTKTKTTTEHNDFNNSTQMEGWLEKKEKRKTWLQYWTVLQDMRLKFYQMEKRNNLIGWIELTVGAQCVMGRESEGKYCFYLVVLGNRFLFRCKCDDSRRKWMCAVGMSYPMHQIRRGECFIEISY